MDELDSKILDKLKENGRASFTSIAEGLDVSEGTVRNRVQELEEGGVIEKFTVETTENSFKAVAMFEVSVEVDIRELIENFPENIEIYEVTGEYDIIVVFSRNSTEEVNDTLDYIRELEGVTSSKTYTVLKTTKH